MGQRPSEERTMTQDTTRSCPYGLERYLAQSTFEEALEKVTVALKGEGFGILTQIDVKETFVDTWPP